MHNINGQTINMIILKTTFGSVFFVNYNDLYITLQ